MRGVARRDRLERCKRIAKLLATWPLLSCGCRLKMVPCDCPDVCCCPVELDLCECAADSDTELIWFFLWEADPENYRDPPLSPQPTKAITRELVILVQQARVANGFRPQHPDDVDPRKIKGGRTVVRSRNGRSAEGEWYDPWGDDDEPWWDDYMEYAFSKSVPGEEILRFPLFYAGNQPVSFYDLPERVQSEQIRTEEEELRRKFKVRRGLYTQLKGILKRLGAFKEIARLDGWAEKEREFLG